MKKLLSLCLILLMIIAFLGCKEKKNLETFRSIDCSIYSKSLKSVKIFKDGKTYIRLDNNAIINQNFLETKEFYSVELSKIQLDSVSKMTNSLLNNGFTRFSEMSADGHLSFSIIIKPNTDLIRTNTNNKEKQDSVIKTMYHLVNYLDGLFSSTKSKVDSTFTFESRKNIIIPGQSLNRK